MRIGASLALFAFGAILGLAVHVDNSVINVNLIGLILMLVAVVGFALSPAAMSVQRRMTITKSSGGVGATQTQETTEEVDEQDRETVDHPRWAVRPAAEAERADDDSRVAQRTDRSWPTAG